MLSLQLFATGAVARRGGLPQPGLKMPLVTTLCMHLPTLTNGFSCGYVRLELLLAVSAGDSYRLLRPSIIYSSLAMVCVGDYSLLCLQLCAVGAAARRGCLPQPGLGGGPQASAVCSGQVAAAAGLRRIPSRPGFHGFPYTSGKLLHLPWFLCILHIA